MLKNNNKQNDKINDAPLGLGQVVHSFLASYIAEHQDHIPKGNLYDLVMNEVEKPLLMIVMSMTHDNQKKASELLGINRNTLRKKLKEYELVEEN